MKWDDRSTLFPDGLRLKPPVRSQHHDVCRARACRETTGMTTENYTRSPDIFLLFFHLLFLFLFLFLFVRFSIVRADAKTRKKTSNGSRCKNDDFLF